MTLYGKITRDLQDTGERQDFDSPPPAKEEIASGKPYWVPVVKQTVDNSTGPDTVVTTDKAVSDAAITFTKTIRDKTQAEIDAQQTAEIDAAIDAVQQNRSELKALAEGLFIAYNEAREAGGKQPITKQQFLTWLREQL